MWPIKGEKHRKGKWEDAVRQEKVELKKIQ